MPPLYIVTWPSIRSQYDDPATDGQGPRQHTVGQLHAPHEARSVTRTAHRAREWRSLGSPRPMHPSVPTVPRLREGSHGSRCAASEGRMWSRGRSPRISSAALSAGDFHFALTAESTNRRAFIGAVFLSQTCFPRTALSIHCHYRHPSNQSSVSARADKLPKWPSNSCMHAVQRPRVLPVYISLASSHRRPSVSYRPPFAVIIRTLHHPNLVFISRTGLPTPCSYLQSAFASLGAMASHTPAS